jgi:hypothetical protein
MLCACAVSVLADPWHCGAQWVVCVACVHRNWSSLAFAGSAVAVAAVAASLAAFVRELHPRDEYELLHDEVLDGWVLETDAKSHQTLTKVRLSSVLAINWAGDVGCVCLRSGSPRAALFVGIP